MFRRKRKQPKKRVVDPRLTRRVETLSAHDLFTNLDNVLMTMHSLVDAFHYHDAPSGEVSVAIDAIYTLWTEILSRDV